jgi:hypothetical protein
MGGVMMTGVEMEGGVTMGGQAMMREVGMKGGYVGSDVDINVGGETSAATSL